MYGFENWIIKKAEHQIIDAFQLWCRRRLLRVPWTARRSNQSILKEINPEHSSEGLIMKLQYFGHLMRRADTFSWCWETVGAGGEEGDRGWDGWMASPTQWTWARANLGRQGRTGKPSILQSPQVFEPCLTKSRTWLSDWTRTINKSPSNLIQVHLQVIYLGFSDKTIWK